MMVLQCPAPCALRGDGVGGIMRVAEARARGWGMALDPVLVLRDQRVPATRILAESQERSNAVTDAEELVSASPAGEGGLHVCPSCRVPNRDRARFCATCGATLPLVCAHCGASLTPTLRFCPKCGITAQPDRALPRGADEALPPNTRLEDRYVVDRLLGKGGYARVYLAHDLGSGGRACAIKELTDNSPENQRQFEREATLLRLLSHPRLVRVTDHFQTAAGEMFLVMDLILGDDLFHVLDQAGGALPEDRVVRWALQVCEVLEYMHTWVHPATGRPSPIIHRDIKPGNLKLQPDDSIIVIDLGIAKVKQPGHQTTMVARAVSPPYSPLEQYGQGTDERSDIYALGATLYHLATANPPPEAPDIPASHLPSPRQLNPTLSPRLEQTIAGAMQVAPADRFQSIAELRAALTGRPAAAPIGRRSEPLPAQPGGAGRPPSPPPEPRLPGMSEPPGSTQSRPRPAPSRRAAPAPPPPPDWTLAQRGLGALAILGLIALAIVLIAVSLQMPPP